MHLTTVVFIQAWLFLSRACADSILYCRRREKGQRRTQSRGNYSWLRNFARISTASITVSNQEDNGCLRLLRFDSLLRGSLVVVNMLFNSQARHLLGKGLSVLGMAHGVDDRVEATSSFGAEAGHLGQKRSDGGLASNDSKEDNKGIGRPDASPQGDIGDSNLGNTDLSRLSLRVSIGPQGIHIHLLGLFTKSMLMSPDGLDNGRVEEVDHNHGDDIAEEESKENIRLLAPFLAQVVIAGNQK